jgi:hypothetical protein
MTSIGSAQDASPETGREMVRRQFEASGLTVGSQFPDRQIYDADGKPFDTAELRGSFTVLVTGCLT